MSHRLFSKRWIFLCAVLVTTAFCVFVLPFFFPPPYLKGVSVSNVTGFNNKVASVTAALISVFVFLFALRWPLLQEESDAGDYRRISPKLVWILSAVSAILLSILSVIIVRSHLLYLRDAGYFIGKITMHLQYGQKLYEQIEFPYGPLLFYSPVAIARILSPFHISITTAYYVTLVLEHVLGLLLVRYVLDRLPMLHKWKTLLFVLCALGTLQMNMGLNYTFLRFLLSPAFLLFSICRKQSWSVALCFFLGMMVSFAVSPEMALAFGAASVSYAAYFCFRHGRAWLLTLVAPVVGSAVFFLLVSRGYLIMLKLFALGVLNFVVEPLPHSLIFLFALVWLVPAGLALFFQRRHPDAPMLAALYIFSLALLPVVFGRADPGHVFFDGLVLFFLSMVTISVAQPAYQRAWALILSAFFLWAISINIQVSHFQLQPAISQGILGYQVRVFSPAAHILLRTGSLREAEQRLEKIPDDLPFDVQQLQGTVGHGPVATPLPLPPYVTDDLKSAGLFTPSYYWDLVDVYDATAEQRIVDDFNQFHWALLPSDPTVVITEAPSYTSFAMGFQLTYPEKHPPYVIGNLFNHNLATNWEFVREIGSYKVYRRR